MNYTQHEYDIDAIRRRWSHLSSNDIGLTDAQRQIVTDVEVILEHIDPPPYKRSHELTNLIYGLADGKWDRDDITDACDELSRAYENDGQAHAEDLIDALTPHLKRLGPPPDGDVLGYHVTVARAIVLLWDFSESEHRAEFVCDGYRLWLALPLMKGIGPDGSTFELTCEQIKAIRLAL